MAHYVTRLVVEKVEDGDRRNKSTIANIVVSAADLENLKLKASQHLSLVEDGGDIDQRVMR